MKLNLLRLAERFEKSEMWKEKKKPNLLNRLFNIKVKTDIILVIEFEGARVSVYPSGRVLVSDCGEDCEAIAYKFAKIMESFSKEKKKLALFIGRFQPFHKGHLAVIKDILKENDEIAIVIAGPRKPDEKNPFSFEERKEMIEKALKNEGVANYIIHKIYDVNDDRKWAKAIKDLGDFDVAYSRNSWTIRCLKMVGIPVKKHKFYERYKHCGTKIRKRMADGKKWEDLVPEAVYEYIMKKRKTNVL
ncbi:MAG: nicotinamide-nucleotide adenylyltransferase [Candidatus Aenigmarchaeota archaeon]|nr:nicotinamide-nucleotide adenylyltransferase [Candidatus Aenigmarchaeota archaeon]